jgi:hypothetical protein
VIHSHESWRYQQCTGLSTVEQDDACAVEVEYIMKTMRACDLLVFLLVKLKWNCGPRISVHGSFDDWVATEKTVGYFIHSELEISTGKPKTTVVQQSFLFSFMT